MGGKDHPRIERRITNLLITYWERLKGLKTLPLERDIDPEVIDSLWPHCFMVRMKDLEQGGGYRYTYVGNLLVLKQDQPLVDSVSPPMASLRADCVHEKYLEAGAGRKPVYDEGILDASYGRIIRYRQIFLPFSVNGYDASSILGAMRYMVEE